MQEDCLLGLKKTRRDPPSLGLSYLLAFRRASDAIGRRGTSKGAAYNRRLYRRSLPSSVLYVIYVICIFNF